MKKNVKETVREAILPTVTELGYRIWDVTYSKIGADYPLEITIDNDEGINITPSFLCTFHPVFPVKFFLIFP